jgi:hypothetical protein
VKPTAAGKASRQTFHFHDNSFDSRRMPISTLQAVLEAHLGCHDDLSSGVVSNDARTSLRLVVVVGRFVLMLADDESYWRWLLDEAGCSAG